VDELAPERSPKARLRLAAIAVVGLAILLVGGQTFVDGAVRLAVLLGMSDRLIGLTIVAVGTSLPEMAASLVAAVRAHAGLAVGNIVGSNIFNVLLIAGTAGLLSPIAGSLAESKLDIGMLLGFTVLAVLFLRTERRMSRLEGAVLVAAYAGFLAVLAL
jgi:cation:H+ antiporter